MCPRVLKLVDSVYNRQFECFNRDSTNMIMIYIIRQKCWMLNTNDESYNSVHTKITFIVLHGYNSCGGMRVDSIWMVSNSSGNRGGLDDEIRLSVSISNTSNRSGVRDGISFRFYNVKRIVGEVQANPNWFVSDSENGVVIHD